MVDLNVRQYTRALQAFRVFNDPEKAEIALYKLGLKLVALTSVTNAELDMMTQAVIQDMNSQ